MNWNNSIFLIDAKYLCYRSVFALFNMELSSVENAMMYGFMDTLRSLAKGLKVTQKKIIKPSNIILCWDSKHSYRRMVYPDYKKKPKLDDHQEKVIAKIQEAYPKLRYWMNRIGFTSALCPGYEADDLFAGYVRQCSNKKIVDDAWVTDNRYIIITNDEDIYQLLDYHVAMWMLRKKPILFTVEDFMNKYAIGPKEWYMVKAIGGCKSDNVPGLEGIGEKRAIQYLKGEASSKIVSKVSEHYDKELSLYYRLTYLPFDQRKFNLSLKPTEIDWDAFTKWAQIYNMKRFIMQYDKFKEVFDFDNR